MAVPRNKRIADISPVAQVIVASTASQFLDLLSLRGELFADPKDQWLFRGHSDSSWDLVPAVLRNRDKALVHRLAGIEPDVQYKDHRHQQVAAEVTLLEKFVFEANRIGLPIPGDGATCVSMVQQEPWTSNPNSLQQLKTNLLFDSEWPPHAMTPSLCLCQHHGIPTRLLDWTLSPEKAAYFAVTDMKTKKTSKLEKKCCVWAFRSQVRRFGANVMLPFVEVIESYRMENRYLHAQDGVFTLCRSGAFRWSNRPDVDRRSLDTQFRDVASELGEGLPFPIFYQITLPSSEAVMCKRLLASQFIDSATMFPDYSGVVRLLKERADIARLNRK